MSEHDLKNLKRPSVEDAMLYRREHGITDEEGNDLPLCVDIRVLKKYGLGLYMFFELMRRLILLFLLLSAVYGVAIYSNASGNGLAIYRDFKSTIMTLSLGNQDRLVLLADNSTAENQAENSRRYNAFVANARVNYFLVAIPDAVCVLVFILFYALWVCFFQSTKEEYKKKYPTPSRFTVEVHGLPPTGVKEAEVWRHFSRVGELVEVKACTTSTEIIRKFEGVGDKSQEVKRCLKLSEYEEDDRRRQEHLERLEAVKADMYEDIADAKALIRDYSVNGREF
jgi:hypothetical protein